ncbi:DUF3618 domain-containing protein [Georgenia subflava]|uniref:DUF3618 domain-containing protein n=1 Tax=Georgenia subflava TaxID=1622177 RepID=A0A6N7EJX6_9MICO|nr:DUF3618 domain-containing protein [Georgenia subflava]MPV36855.1 DUF3618 domain-containing protein [Georgenia subflava]
MSEDAKKRTPEQIEADLAKTRLDLTNTVNELSDRLDPRAQVDAAKESARAAAKEAGEKAKVFKDDVTSGDPKALGLLGAGIAVVALIVTLRLRGR